MKSITLRPLKPSDAEDLNQASNDAGPPYGNTILPLKKTKEYIRQALAQKSKNRTFAITEGDIVIGTVGLVPISPSSYEIDGIWIRQSKQQKGIATAALKLLIARAYELGASELIAFIEPTNVKSQKLFERVGFKKGALVKNERQIAGAPTDHFRYELNL